MAYSREIRSSLINYLVVMFCLHTRPLYSDWTRCLGCLARSTLSLCTQRGNRQLLCRQKKLRLVLWTHRRLHAVLPASRWTFNRGRLYQSVHSRLVMVISHCLHACLAPPAPTPSLRWVAPTRCRLPTRPAVTCSPGLRSFSRSMLYHSVRNVMNFAHRLSLHACLVPPAPKLRLCRRMLNRLVTPTRFCLSVQMHTYQLVKMPSLCVYAGRTTQSLV